MIKKKQRSCTDRCFFGLRFYDSSEFHFFEAVNYVVMLGVSGKEQYLQERMRRGINESI